MRIAERPYEGVRLLAVIHMDTDSPTWEMHPAGDELLYLLRGRIDLGLQHEEAESLTELHANTACIASPLARAIV